MANYATLDDDTLIAALLAQSAADTGPVELPPVELTNPVAVSNEPPICDDVPMEESPIEGIENLDIDINSALDAALAGALSEVYRAASSIF